MTTRRPERQLGTAFHPPDYWLLVLVLGLLGFGLLMVYSASSIVAYQEFGSPFHYFVRQAQWAALGLLGMVIALQIDYRRWGGLALPGLVISIVLLAYASVPGLGHEVHGASRWIKIGTISFQPSEWAKLALIVYMAEWLSRKERQVAEFALGFVPFCVLLGIVVVLLQLQRDLGSTAVVALTSVAVFFAAGASVWQLVLLAVGGTGVTAILIMGTGYRLRRIAAFADPWADPQGYGYHVIQALLALGAGGATGVGLGMGRGKFWWLPFPHTDSIFAVIGEELGLLGTLAVLLLFVLFAYRGLRIAWHAADRMGQLLAAGITCGIAVQALINIAVLTSSVPFTGITLPFISYGGSSLAVTLVSAGVLLSVSRYTVDRDLDRGKHARSDLWRRHRWAYLPSFGRRQRASQQPS